MKQTGLILTGNSKHPAVSVLRLYIHWYVSFLNWWQAIDVAERIIENKTGVRTTGYQNYTTVLIRKLEYL